MLKPKFQNDGGIFIVHFSSKVEQTNKVIEPPLTERQRKTLEYIQEKGSITSSEYQELFNVKKRQSQKDLTVMVEENLLVVEGRGPATRYLVRDSARLMGE